MNVRWIKQVFSAAAIGSTMLIGSASSAGDHRMFPDEPKRPHVSAACQPNWGYNQTCWQRFPPVAPCPGQGGCENGQCGLNPVYVPQSFQPHSLPMQSQAVPMQPTAPMSPSPAPVAEYPVPMMHQPGQQTPPSFFPAPGMEPSFVHPQSSMTEPPVQYNPPAGQVFEAPGIAPALPPLPGPLPAAELPPHPVPAVPNQSGTRSGRQDYRTHAPQMMPAAKLQGPGSQNRYGDRIASAPMPAPAPRTTNRYAGQSPNIASIGSATQVPPASVATATSEGQSPKNLPASTNTKPTMRYASGNANVPVMPASSARYLKQVR